MAIRTILVGSSGGPASAGATSLACHVAQRFGAHIECYHAKLDPRELVVLANFGNVGMTMNGAWLEEMEAQTQQAAAQAKQAALAIFRQRGIDVADRPPYSGPSAVWVEESGGAPRLVSRRARFFDLTILG